MYDSFRIIHTYVSEYYNNNSFITDSWSMPQAQSHNARAQKMVSHSSLQNRRLRTTNTDGIVVSFTHHNTGIKQCEENKGI